MTPSNADDPLRTADAPPVTITHTAAPADPYATATLSPSRGGTDPGEPVAQSNPFPEIPGYRIEAVLGRGGMGVVYKARHLALKRTVALKMVLAGGHAGPRERARFRTEAEAVARLQHPNIVQIHEVGEAGGLPYCALEFVEGGTLAGRLDGRSLPPGEAATLVDALARAMQLAHSRHVVHRDLKPANILLAADGTPKITDFGLARQLDGDGGETQAGAVMGTPSYMAPEQASGRAHEAGPAADVYALGAILYECLAGRPPFKGATVVETLDQVRTREPVPPSRVQPKVPFDLETICLKALAKEPARRYPTAGDLAADLRRFLDDEPIHARRVGVAEKLWRRARKNPALVGLMAAVLVLGVGGAWVATRPPPEPPAPVAAADPPDVDTSAEELLRVVTELDRTDPGWRLEQIEEKRPAVPDDQNGALQILAFRDLVSDLRGEPRHRQAGSTWESPQLQERLNALSRLSPTGPLSEADAADFRAELKRVERPLAQARKLAGYPRGRFPITYKRDGVSTLLPHLAQTRSMVRLLYLDAIVQTHDGQRTAAVQDCLAMAHAANALRDEPSMISQAIVMALHQSVVKALERLAARGPCTDAELRSLQEVLAGAATDPLLVIGARGDRAMLHDTFGALETGDLAMKDLFAATDPPQEVQQPPTPKEVRVLHAWLLRYYTKVVEIAGRPPDQRPVLLAVLEEDLKSAPLAGTPFFGALMRSYVQDSLRHSSHLALLRSCVAALAAERHRLAHGEWPRDLTALVPGYLKEVPQDPYDGRPLRYRRTAEGVVVYSVGKDRADDQGKLNRTSQPVEGTDTGFQLWDPGHRR